VKHRRRHRLRLVGRNNGFTGKPQLNDKIHRPRKSRSLRDKSLTSECEQARHNPRQCRLRNNGFYRPRALKEAGEKLRCRVAPNSSHAPCNPRLPFPKRPRLWPRHSRTKEMRAINEIATANETGPSDFPFGTVAKKRRADSHHGCAFFHGNLEIMTHSHAQMGQGRA
jgi:hypothetical protein